MSSFRIFTESKADIRFIRDYVSEHFKEILSETVDFDILEGNGGYKKGGRLKSSIQQNHDSDKQTILILDADNNFTQRNAEVIRDFQDYNIPVNLFLFPNDAHIGNLETLLTEIAVDRTPINCFMTYEECVRAYNLPLDKSRIYAYLDAVLPQESKIHKKNDLRIAENRNYRDSDYWNLHHEYLKPLHDFLSPFFLEK
jgi:hypothetical protein